jgi:hypothetical protein
MPTARPLPDGVTSIGKLLKKSGGLEYAFSVPCPKCHSERIVKRRQHAIGMSSKICKRCSNKNNKPIGLVGRIRLSFFKKYEVGAHQRNKSWAISAEDAAEQFEIQKSKCALTGIELDAGASGCNPNQITASLDRIDNSIGYEKGNLQWVHKDVNMMRGSLSIERFKEICSLVADREKVVE